MKFRRTIKFGNRKMPFDARKTRRIDFYLIDASNLRSFLDLSRLVENRRQKTAAIEFWTRIIRKSQRIAFRFVAMTFRFRQRTKFRFGACFHRRAAKQQHESAQPDYEQARCDLSCFVLREKRIHQRLNYQKKAFLSNFLILDRSINKQKSLLLIV